MVFITTPEESLRRYSGRVREMTSSLLSRSATYESKRVQLAAPYNEFTILWYFDVLQKLGMQIRCAKRTHLRLKHQPVGKAAACPPYSARRVRVTATASSDFC